MKPQLSQRIQFFLAYLLVVVVALSLLQSWLLAPRTVEIPMSRFLELLRADKIERVALTERDIRGMAKPGALPPHAGGPGDRLRQMLGLEDEGRIFVTTRIPGVDDQRLVQELESRGVEFAGRIETTVWRDLLVGWVIPLAIMVAIWMFLMRRMGGGPTQALSFGRSKHKIYDRKELKTTFADVAGVDEAKAELIEIVDFLKNPRKVPAAGRPHPQGRAARRPPGHGQDAAGPGRGRRGRRSLLHPVGLRVRGDVRRGRRLPACGTSSSRPRRRRPASCSSTSSMPSASRGRATPASWAGTTSASRR